MPQILEQKGKKRPSSFLLLSVFAWAAFLCSATDFYPILKELIWDFCPSQDLSETGGIWFIRRGQADGLMETLHGPSTFSSYTEVLRTRSPKSWMLLLSLPWTLKQNVGCDIKFCTASIFPLIVRTPFWTDLNFHLISNPLCCSFRTFLTNSWGFCLILFFFSEWNKHCFKEDASSFGKNGNSTNNKLNTQSLKF